MTGKNNAHQQNDCKTTYKMITWLDNALPDITVTMKSGKTTCHFTGSYDGRHALTAKLFTHMVNDGLETNSENSSGEVPKGDEIDAES